MIFIIASKCFLYNSSPWAADPGAVHQRCPCPAAGERGRDRSTAAPRRLLMGNLSHMNSTAQSQKVINQSPYTIQCRNNKTFRKTYSLPFLRHFQRTIMNIISSPPCDTSKHEGSPAFAELFGGRTSEKGVGWAANTHLTKLF